MAEAARSHARGRWARPLALLAFGPVLAQAQAPACTPAAPWLFPSQYYVAPVSARPVGNSLLVIGDPSYRFATGADGKFVTVDTVLAGVQVSPDGVARAFARPASARAFVHPRMVPRSKRRTDVLWSEPDFDAGGTYGAGPHFVRVGTLVDGDWKEIRALGRFDLNAALTRDMGSDLLTVDGVSYMAFPDEEPVTRKRRIVLLSDSGGRWATNRLDFEMVVTGATELGDDSGTLAVIFLGIPRVRPRTEASLTSTVGLARRERDGWSRATQIGGDAARYVELPKLVRYGNSLIAAWLKTESTLTLEWREVTRGRAPGPVHRIEGIGTMAQGQAPFRDLLSLAALDGVGRIVRLRPDGYDLIAEVRLAAALAPVVAGSRERPWVLTVEPIETPDPGPFRLVARDLRCALRR